MKELYQIYLHASEVNYCHSKFLYICIQNISQFKENKKCLLLLLEENFLCYINKLPCCKKYI